MASALARTIGVLTNAGALSLSLEVAYSGNAQTEIGGGGYVVTVEVPLLATDQPAAIRTKMSNAIAADAAARGFSVSSADMTLPTFQKG